jgi:hypothetical protein
MTVKEHGPVGTPPIGPPCQSGNRFYAKWQGPLGTSFTIRLCDPNNLTTSVSCLFLRLLAHLPNQRLLSDVPALPKKPHAPCLNILGEPPPAVGAKPPFGFANPGRLAIDGTLTR